MTTAAGTRPLTERLAAVARQVREQCGGDTPLRESLAEILAGLDEPLRVAVAGRTKAGKSTLVNALLRQRVAATDVGECTKLVTWYRFGVPERVEVVHDDGARTRLGLGADGALPETLPVPEGTKIDRIDVWLSNESLRSVTLIDTPGLSSANDVLSGITREMLAIDDASRRAASQADALVFVLALGAHSDDRDALARFRNLFGAIESSAVNAICVLNKADKIEDDDATAALAAAHSLAGEVAPLLQLSVANVVPSVALVAESIESGVFTERHAEVLRGLAERDPAELDAMLLSVDRFVRGGSHADQAEREALVRCLDLWGLRHGVQLVRDGHRSGSALARELGRSSGIERVRTLLLDNFARHADALKAQWAMAALDRMASPAGADDPDAAVKYSLRSTLEDLRLDPDMHRLAEVAAFQMSVRQDVVLPGDLAADVQALLAGTTPERRAGLADGAPVAAVVAAAATGAGRWKSYANDPRRSPDEQRIADVFVRSYEFLWAAAAQRAGRG